MAGRATDGEQRIALAAVAGAHGIRGEVRLKLFSDTAESLTLHPKLFVGGVERKLTSVRAAGKGAVARFEGVSDRSAAEQLRGSLIEIERDALPPLAEGEYYHADLIGLPCFDGEGASLGTVVAVENFGAGDLLEVADSGGRRSLIPFKPGIADLEDGRIVLDPEFLA
jgi:16S rRNA processing protein RimM